MTHAELDAFLAVCRHKNITKAAEELFVTQGALSSRLKSLEKDIGCTLFLRNKGKHGIELTAQGHAVYDLALQNHDILAKIKAVGTASSTERLRVATITSVGNYLLPPVFDRFMEQFPNIHFLVEYNTVFPACSSLIAGELDLAFVTVKIETDQIIATPVLADPLVLLCSNNTELHEPVSTAMLQTKDEVLAHWSTGVTFWHQALFGAAAEPFIDLRYMELVGHNIAKPGKWGFVPLSMADCLCKTLPVHQCKTAFPLPNRMIYALRSRDTAEAPNIRLFLNILRADLLERNIHGVLL